MREVFDWVSRYWKILVVLAGVIFWAGRLDMKVESLDEKVDLVIQILLEGEDGGNVSKLAQGAGASSEAPDVRENP